MSLAHRVAVRTWMGRARLLEVRAPDTVPTDNEEGVRCVLDFVKTSMPAAQTVLVSVKPVEVRE